MMEFGKNVTPSKAVQRSLTKALGPQTVFPVRCFDLQCFGDSSGLIADFSVMDLVVSVILGSCAATGLCGVTVVCFSSGPISSAGSGVESCGLQASAYVTLSYGTIPFLGKT